MSEPPKLFTSIAEIRSRPAFDETASISIHDFAGLIGPYFFGANEPVHCQVEHENQRCNQPHQHGFLGRTNSGLEALIGNKCGKNHFGATDAYAKETRRVKTEVRITNVLAELAGLLADRDTLLSDVSRQLERIRNVRSYVKVLDERLPQTLIARLRAMAKTGNRRVFVEFARKEVDEEGSEKTIWEREGLDSVAGVSILLLDRLTPLVQGLHLIRDIASTAALSREVDVRQLVRWRDALRQLPVLRSAIDGIEAEHRAFGAQNNLESLIVMARDEDKADVALAVLGPMSNKAAKRFVEKVDERIRHLNGGRRFRAA
jgi:hypothetical protein